MSEMKVFNYNENEVRTIEKDGEPWFVLKDVCEIFGETNYRRVAGRLDEDEKGVSQITTPGGPQNMTVINETGLYSTLFVMQPEKARGVDEGYIKKRQEQLKSFKRWVTHEVIPAIRKHGAYMTPAVIEQTLLNPDFIIQLAQKLKEEQARSQRMMEQAALMAAQIEMQRYKVDYFDALVDKHLLTSIRETVKLLRVKEKEFIDWMLRDKFLYRGKDGKLLPYAGRDTEDGLFEVKEVYDADKNWVGVQTFVTPKGRVTFRILIEDHGAIWPKMKLRDFFKS